MHKTRGTLIAHLQGREKLLRPLGFTGLQAEWITLVCLHCGESDPLFFAAGAARGRAKGDRGRDTLFPPCREVALTTEIPAEFICH